MSIITRVLKQTATYWAPTGVDKLGLPTYALPITISVRWDDLVEQFMPTTEGEQDEIQFSRAKVMCSQDVAVKGLLHLGVLSNTDDPDEPRTIAGAYEIRAFEKIPNFKATEFVRTAIL